MWSISDIILTVVFVFVMLCISAIITFMAFVIMEELDHIGDDDDGDDGSHYNNTIKHW